MLRIEDLTFRMQGRLLLDATTVHIPMGARVGFVGRNGTGKTTLFKLITGEYAPESGSLELRRGVTIGQVAQEAPGTDMSLLDTVLAADTERTNLLAEAETAKDPTRIADIHTRLADIEAHSAEARAGAILHGLGFDAKAQGQPCSAFSGGWRMRVALAAVLFAEPDLLLLDEPTNYLDLEGTLWLENYIARYKHTVIIISHDRDLLNTCCNTIVHLENLKLTSYKGDYDFFEKTRAERMVLQGKMKVKQDAKRAHMQAFIDRFKAKASKATQAQSRIKALERMGSIAAVQETDVAPLSFPSPEKVAASPIINLERVSAGYEEGQSGHFADRPAHRCRRPHRVAGCQRQRQVHLRQTCRRSPGGGGRYYRWHDHPRRQDAGGHVRPAQHGRPRARTVRARTRAETCAG